MTYSKKSYQNNSLDPTKEIASFPALMSYPIKCRRLRWACHVVRMEEGRSAKPTGKIPLERHRRRWENNIRMDLKEIAINTRNSIDLAQDRAYWRTLVNAALNLQVS